MADIWGNVKQLKDRLSAFKYLFVVAFFILSGIFALYSYTLHQRNEAQRERHVAARENFQTFKEHSALVAEKLENAFAHTLKYHVDRRHTSQYQAVAALDRANEVFGDLRDFNSNEKGGQLELITTLSDKILQFETGLLEELNVQQDLPEIQIAPLIIGEDTVSIEAALTSNANTTSSGDFATEENTLRHIKALIFEWQTDLSADISGISEQATINDGGVFWLFVTGILLFMGGFYLVIEQRLRSNVDQAGVALEKLSVGDIETVDALDRNRGEFSKVFSNTSAIVEYLDNTSQFAVKIGEGDFAFHFQPKSEKDALGNALIQMRDRLQEVAREDRLRNWMNEGYARLSDILRSSGNDFEELGDSIISFLVDYLKASMGAIYIIDEESGEDHLKLLSAYAFNRKKHEQRVLKAGEGLTGQVFIEKKSVFLKDIPSGHFDIVTGLGQSKPASVFIVPLKDEDTVEGVLELASFEPITEHEREFIERMAENIASAIRSAKDNETTKRLLHESQQKEEQMKAQEEELRQNMEELSATQEQVERLRQDDENRRRELEEKRATLYAVLNQISDQVYLKDDEGKYVYINKPYAIAHGRMVEDFVGKTDFDIFSQDEAESQKVKEKQVLETGESFTDREERPDTTGKKVKAEVKYVPLRINYLEKDGVLCIINI